MSIVQVLGARVLPEASQSARLDVVTADGTQMVLHDPASATRVTVEAASDGLRMATAAREAVRGDTVGISFDGADRTLDRETVQRLADGASSARAYLDGSGFAGDLVSLHRAEVGGTAYVYVARQAGDGFTVYREEADGGLTRITAQRDNGGRYLESVSAMDSIAVGGRRFVIAASAAEDGLTIYEHRANGDLNQRGSYGFSEQLPVNTPTALHTVEIEGRGFVLMTSFGSSSLSVLEVREGGQLVFIDQVNDTIGTRFYRPAALDVISVDGRVLVAVAGNDGGLSLFRMLPGGRLMHLEALEDTTGAALAGISQLRFVQNGAQLDLYALAAREGGLTRIAVDPGEGVSGGQTGTAADDILSDGDGSEVLTGRAGRDVFVFTPDGQADTIADFEPGIDRIDLSGFAGLFGLDDLVMRGNSNGITLTWADETLILRSADGRRIDPLHLSHGMLFDSDHVIVPDALPVLGSATNDTFEWRAGPDTFDGGQGLDTVSYDGAPDRIVIDLSDSSRNARTAEGDVLIGIEAVIGTGSNDTIRGSEADNVLDGGNGHDLLEGRDGDDVIVTGRGWDTVDGGTGNDTLDLGTVIAPVNADLAAGTATSGGETKEIRNIENVAGSEFDDRVAGDTGSNVLRGRDGNDRLLGLAGDDVLDGGAGADTLNGGDGDDRITGGPSGPSADLRDVIFGGAGDDRVEGGGGNDLIYGQQGNDTLDGGFGADELQGQEGDDVVTGGALSDLVFGGAGNDFVNGGFGHDRINGGTGADRFFHLGVHDHGSDWVQDFTSAEGDRLVFGGSAVADQFQVNFAHTATPDGDRSGADDVAEAFVIYRPTGQILWALVDGGAEERIELSLGGEVIDLLS
ncbi:calcium-binding protein [Lutimaribacter marinistellae]|uniref:Calcium-binding protein n=1 Tax=Lutimaribacter marinistellae TaxID=1820329 RepID=A0ABV7TBE7_9RHOB